MGQKIRGRAGSSLGGNYDVPGGSIELGEIDGDAVHLVEEMGSRLFSERFSTSTRALSSTAQNQNTNFALFLGSLPDVPFRIQSVIVTVDVTSRLSRLSLALRSTRSGQEMPLFLFDGNETTIDMDIDGGGTAARIALDPDQNYNPLPVLVAGPGQPQTMANFIVMRGQTLGFGAGTVIARAQFLLSFAQVGGISSLGLPIPSW